MTEALLDATRAEDRLDFALARAEVADWQLQRLAAERMAAVVAVVREARCNPDSYVIVRDEPTARDISFAVEAALADVALRLSISESSVAALARRGELLTARAEAVWRVFREGEMSPENAACVADLLRVFPKTQPRMPGSPTARSRSPRSPRLDSASGCGRSVTGCIRSRSKSAMIVREPLGAPGSSTISTAWRGSAFT